MTPRTKAAVRRVAKWLDARDAFCKRSIAEPTYVAVVPGVPLEESALMTADLRALLALAEEAMRIKATSAAFLKWAREGHAGEMPQPVINVGKDRIVRMPRSDFEKLYTPAERRAMRTNPRLRDVVPDMVHTTKRRKR